MKICSCSYEYMDHATASVWSGNLLILAEGRIIVCTVLHTSARPPQDQYLYMMIESVLGYWHVDDVIIYYVKTHRSHLGVPYDAPETTCLHLVRNKTDIAVLSARTLLHRPQLIEEMLRYAFLTDIADVLSNTVYHAAMSD